MPDTANALASDTGLPDDLVQKGLGALLDFVRQRLGDDAFASVQAAIPGAGEFLRRFESSYESDGTQGVLAVLTGLATKWIGGEAADLTRLLDAFAKVGFQPAQIESFLPRALAFLRAHLPAELLDQLLSQIPGLSKFAAPASE